MHAADSRVARIIDRTLDLLMVMILLGAPLVFYTKAHDVFEFNKFTVVHDISLLSAALFLFKLLYVRPLDLTRSATDWPLLMWVGVSCICAFNTVNQNLSLHGVYEDFEGLTSLLNYAFLLYFMQQHVRTQRQISLVIGSVILAGTVAGFYGMLQNFGIDFVPWNPTTYSADRMFSTMGNPNFLAAYLVMSLPVCLVVFLDLPDRIATDRNFCAFLTVLGLFGLIGLCVLFDVNYLNFSPSYYGVSDVLAIFATQKFWIVHILLGFPLIAAGLLFYGRLRIVLLVSMFFQIVAILFTKSRGGGIAMMVIALIFVPYFIWDWRRGSSVIKRNRWWLLGFLVLLLLAQFNESVRDTTLHMFGRMGDLLQPSHFRLTPRLYIWRSALQMLGDRFWFGSGLDTFQIAFPQYRLALYWILEWNGTPEKAHNMVMQIAATMGFMGLLAFFWMMVSFVWRVFCDLREQADASRRLLMVGCFAAVASFFTQNLFSFTVVGYGSLFWMLLGFLPAMQRTWITEDLPAGTEAQGSRGVPVWRAAVIAVSGLGLLALLAGSDFNLTGDSTPARIVLVLIGLVMLFLVLRKNDEAAPSLLPSRALMALVSLGLFMFAVFQTRAWVADSFYKQGQVGMQINNPGFAAAMYQKAAGRIISITPEQDRALYEPTVPVSAAQHITFTAGLNPSQELYWVKMGIAFENAAAAEPKMDLKMVYFRTALAIHQLTLEMNPINGYNYNNKGRVLKGMGEAFNNPEYFKAALVHYSKAVELDSNNVYFNMDFANTYINLGDYGHAFEICQRMTETFNDFAMPFSYAGFIKLRQGKQDEAIKYFQMAVDKDWKNDRGSRALAATNLGLLYAAKGKFVEADKAYRAAVESNPEFPEAYMNWATLLDHHGQRGNAIQVLKAFQSKHPEHDGVKRMLGQMGVRS